MKVVCIIPARSGSKRIKNKNIKPFLGEPLINHTIKAALKSEIFDKIYISTDNENISSKVINDDNIYFLLRNGYSDDKTTVQEACIRSLAQIENENNKKYTVVIQLLATCPLRDYKDIQNAYDFFKKNRLDFLVSGTHYMQNPYWAFKDNKPLFLDGITSRSQDLPTLICPNGAIWIAKIKKLREERTFYGDNLFIYPITWEHGIDIDTIDDFKRAEMIANYNNSGNIKQINDALLTFKYFKRKLLVDKQDIKNMQKEELRTAKHEVVREGEWNIEIDDEVRKKQKINSKIRTYKRNLEYYKKMLKAITTLKNEKYYDIIDLHYIKQMTFEGIAKKFGVTYKTVMKERNNLLKKISLLLNEE